MQVAEQRLPLIRNFLQSNLVSGDVQNLEVVQVVPDRLAVGVELDGVVGQVELFEFGVGEETPVVDLGDLVRAQVQGLEIR